MQSISKGETGPGRNTLYRQSVGHLRRQEAPKYGVVSLNMRASQVEVVVNCLPMQETKEVLISFLGQEDLLEGGMATVR